MGFLFEGCDYQLWATTPGGSASVVDLSGALTAIKWGRLDSDTSITTATLTKSAAGNMLNLSGDPVTRNCCTAVAALEPLLMDLVVVRGGVVRWQGPLARIAESRDTVTLKALDQSAWFRPWRTSPQTTTLTGDPNDVFHKLVGIALGDYAMGVNPQPGHPIGGVVTRAIAAGKRTIGQDIDELSRLGVRWTMVGRSMVFEAADLPPITLTEEHILGDLSIVTDGESWPSRTWVNGSGTIQGVAGGPAGQLLKDVIVSESTIADQNSADVSAFRHQLAGGGDQPAPQIVLPANSSLAGTTPYTFDDLIPGCPVDVYLQGFCTLKADRTRMTLAAVNVEASASRDQVEEAVTVTMKNDTDSSIPTVLS